MPALPFDTWSDEELDELTDEELYRNIGEALLVMDVIEAQKWGSVYYARIEARQALQNL